MSEFAGLRVFIVEDETLVLMNLEDVLLELGCNIVAQAMRLSEAERIAESMPAPDAAILDVNIGGTQIFPVARILEQRGVPIIFASGYGAGGLPEDWQGHEVVAKPYSRDDIAGALRRIRSRIAT